jgi:hypothetical protein
MMNMAATYTMPVAKKRGERPSAVLYLTLFEPQSCAIGDELAPYLAVSPPSIARWIEGERLPRDGTRGL